MFDEAKCYDAAVFGGGLCGFAAARTLARRGAAVLLVERRPVLGWELTWAYHRVLGTPAGETAGWFAAAMTAAGGCRDGQLDPPIAELVLDREAAAAGMDVLLYAQHVAVSCREGRLTGVVLGTKAGELVVRARAVLDATENALLWRLAGGEAEPPEDPAARYALVLNNVSPDAATDVEGAAVRPAPWPGEAAVEFTVPDGDIRSARLALPDVLRAVREQAPVPDEALVTAVAVEPYPMSPWRSAKRDGPALNLIPAAPWRASTMFGGALSASQRLAIGDHAAGNTVHALAALMAPDPEEAAPQSQVAPPAHAADVVVCGGGTGGAFAAIAAARRQAKTLLLEAGTGLGGVGTGGGIHSYYHGVTGGLQDEADARLEELTPLFGPPDKTQGFHPWAKQVVLEQMAHEASLQVVYNTTITGVRTEHVPSALPARSDDRGERVRRITAVVAAGPDGNALYEASAFVDGTGDGDVAALAGASFTFGREADGLPHAYSLPAGRLSDDGTLRITNFDAGYCDPTDPVDMTRARRRALQHYWTDRFDAASRLLYIAPVLGLRNSRLVEGDYVLTFADEIAGRQFPDVVAYATSHFDNHGFDFENESDEAMLWVWMLGNWGRRFGCEIPYRCLLPRGIEGLLMACRALSITHDAHNQLRMQRDLQRVGEAAGIAAAMAAQRGSTPRELPIEDLQAELLQTGALGKPEPRQLPAPRQEADIHDASWVPPQPPARPAAEWAERLGTEDGPEAAWQLLRQGTDALPHLLDAAKSEAPACRFWAATALAMMRRPEAAPELRTALAGRRDSEREGRKTAPLWQGAMILLGRLGDRQAVPELCKVLTDSGGGLDTLIAAVRALGRIGDPAAAPAIEQMLERDDLPTERTLQVSVAAVGQVVEDSRWQLDLAGAEALAKLGTPRPDLIQRHLHDERALVRRYAQRLAEDGS